MSVTFAALANISYRWLLCGNTAQFFAIAARMMLCNLLAWQLTGWETALALINLSLAVPMFVGALIAGALVDRLERRRLILLGLLVIVLSEASVFAALLVGRLTFVHLLAATFIGGCAHPFIHPASIAMIHGLLGRERLANGVALLSSGMSLSRIIGPAVTGLVLAVLSTTVAYGMVAALYLLALLCQWQLPENRPEKSAPRSLVQEITSGLRYLAADRGIARCLLFSLPPLMLLMSVQYMLILFADEVWQVGEAGLGIMLTSMGLGAFAGAMAVARLGASVNRIRLMYISAILSTLLFGAFSQSPWFSLAVVLLAAANTSVGMCLVTNQIIIQLLAKDDARGRVSGYILMSYSLAPLALFPLSTLADAIGVDSAVGWASVLVACLVIGLMLLPLRAPAIESPTKSPTTSPTKS